MRLKHASRKNVLQVFEVSDCMDLEEISWDVVVATWIANEVDSLVFLVDLEVTYVGELFSSETDLLGGIHNVQHVFVIADLVETQENILGSIHVLVLKRVILKEVPVHLEYSLDYLHSKFSSLTDLA